MSLAHHDIEARVAAAVRPSSDKTRVIIAATTVHLAEQLKAGMEQDGAVAGHLVETSLSELTRASARELGSVDIVAFEVAREPQDDFTALRLMEDQLLQPQFIAISAVALPPALTRAYLQAGAQDVLVLNAGVDGTDVPATSETTDTPDAGSPLAPAASDVPAQTDAPEAPASQAAPEAPAPVGETPPPEAAPAPVEMPAQAAEPAPAPAAEAPAAPQASPAPAPADPFETDVARRAEEAAAMLRRAPAAAAAAPRPAEAQAPAAAPQQSGGDITVFLRARGGVGASTLAVNLAAAKAAKSDAGRVALVDLDLQNGAIALMLDLPDSAMASRFARGEVAGDAAFLAEAMVRHDSGIDVLTAPDVFAPLTALSPQGVAGLIAALRARYDHIIIDMPQVVTDWMDPILEASARLLVVSDMSLPSVRRTRRLIDLIGEEHMTLPLKVVMNQEKKPVFSSDAHKEAAQLIGRPLLHWIPAEPRPVRRAMDMGKPLVLSARRSAPAKAITALCATLFSEQKDG